ncbi:ABC transporter ATP-binding protein [Rhodovulum sp. FJ3]|jgi:multiple sugar transport system ATP-binding protein|uniref:ABC transporter ATP-binding protein n=1 Tax=Rhodovulum sp. FJ3 TaxID=3079053 RepID=UPI00293DD06C|nr:ABC transporter ATP-binding protein [Rhodovulum sp. FJ3]MDV4169274.1 ABC transporter ATP-binding protein [Rhodovulum sp. FJ3]MEC8629437.1 ABC transporter ATP-binding protein [Pseudomonadota bacterium]MEC8795837.1 ABC transporter ATP-binding protein [Pseudomonadota bacterium]
MAVIEIKNVAKRFGNYQALSDINLTIEDQEFMVLLGASGCGKSTLLRIIAGLETASEGEVWIGGKRIDHLPPKDRGIAMVFQNYAVFPHLTVFENIGFGLRMQKLPNDEVTRRVTRVAELMHIDALLKRYSGELSGGQRQRVAVARALAMEPDVILMDEPLSNLDALLRMEMRAELKGVLAESNTTAIYVTHDQVEAMSMADRISVMHQGKIVQAASPIEVYRNPAAEFVAGFIGNPPMNFLTATPAGAGQWQVAGLALDGPQSGAETLNFAIRPEDLRLSETGMQAKVKIVEPLGAHLLVTCEVDGTLFRAVLDSDLAVKRGDTLTLTPQPDRIRWFDPVSTRAVA